MAQETPPNYQDHVLPIFAAHCLGCHNAEKKKGDLDLSSFGTAMSGGSTGEVLVAGDSAGSSLWKVVAHLDEPKMPPKKARISDPELAVIKKWIEGGLIEAPGGKARKSNKPKFDLGLAGAPKGKPAGPIAMPEHLLLEPPVRTARADALTALAANPWAPVVAVAGQHQVLLYHTDSLELLGVLPFPERRPHVLKFSRNGALLLAGGGRGARLGRVVVWEVKTGERLFEIGEEYDIVLAADISADQTHIALGGPGKLVKIFSTKDGELQHSIKKHTDWVTALEFSPDGARLATGDRNGGVHVWEANTGRIVYTLNGHKGGITDLSWRADSAVVATSSEDGQVMLWEMGGGTRVKGWAAHSATASVDYTHDGRLVTCGRDMLTRVWDAGGNKVRDLEAFADLALHGVFSHDGARVIAGDWSGEVRVWTAADGKRVGSLTTNPPSLAERIAAEAKSLAEAEAHHKKVVAEAAAARDSVLRAETDSAAIKAKALSAQQEVDKAESRLAEAGKALAAVTQTVGAAQDALNARQNDAAAKAESAKQAEKALKGVQAGPELARLTDAARKAKEESDKAAEAQAAAQKLLAERQASVKRLTEQKAAAQSSRDQARSTLAATQQAPASAQKQTEAAAAKVAQATKVVEDAAAQVKVLQGRVARLKAAQFNVKVHEQKAVVAKLQAEVEALVALADKARPAEALKPKLQAAQAQLDQLKVAYLKLLPQ